MARRRRRAVRRPPSTPFEEIPAMPASQTPETDTGELPPCGEEEELTVRPGDTDHCEREEVDTEAAKLGLSTPPGSEEHHVQNAGLTHHQEERVDKTQLVSSEEGDKDAMEHSTEQKKPEHKERTQIPSLEEGDEDTMEHSTEQKNPEDEELTQIPSSEEGDKEAMEHSTEQKKPEHKERTQIPSLEEGDEDAMEHSTEQKNPEDEELTQIPSSEEGDKEAMEQSTEQKKPEHEEQTQIPSSEEGGEDAMEHSTEQKNPEHEELTQIPSSEEGDKDTMEQSTEQKKPEHEELTQIPSSEEGDEDAMAHSAEQKKPEHKELTQIPSSEEGDEDAMEHSTEQKKPEHEELTQIPSSEEGDKDTMEHSTGQKKPKDEEPTQIPTSEEGDDDTMEHSTEQKKPEHEELTQISSSEEDEPKSKKAKLDTSTVVSKDEARTCMLCSKPYEDPAVMECGHRFCCSCINKSGASPDSLSCPDCNKVIKEKKPITNLVSESMAKPTASAASVTASAARTVKKCPEHDEILKMYCEYDDSLCCTICQDSLKHSGHTFLNVVDAMKVCQAKLSNTVSPLEETLKKIGDLSTQQSEQKERLQNTMTDCRQHITSEFGHLYKFLKEQKEKLLEQLKEKKLRLLEEMESNAAKMAEKRDSLREAIAVANEKAMDTDPYSFLDGIKDVRKTCRKQSESSSSFTITEEELCRATFRGPIQYIAWMQMKSIVPEPSSERPCDQSSTSDRNLEDGGQSVKLGDSTVSTKAHIDGQKDTAPMSERPRDREPKDGGPKHGDKEQTFELADSTVSTAAHTGGQKDNAPASKRPCDQSRDRKPEDGGQTHGVRERSFKSGDSTISATAHIGGQKDNAPASKRPRDQSRDRKPEDGGQTHGVRERSFKSGDSTAHIGGQKDNDKGLERPIMLNNSGPKEIWLVGTGYLNAAKDMANRHPLYFNLRVDSSCTVRWLTVKASCRDLIHSIRMWCRTYGIPDVLFFHSNNRDIKLTLDKFNSLFNTVQKDLNAAAVLFPNTEFILSALYPNADELQDHFHSSFAMFAQRPRFSFFRFTELEEMMEAKGKEANLKILTRAELDLFFSSVRKALQDAVNKRCQPVVATQHRQPVVATQHRQPVVQPAVAYHHRKPVVANQQPQPVVANQQPQPVVASQHPQPVVANQQPQPVVASQHPQPVVASLHPQPVVASLHPQTVVASLHPQPVVASLHPQPVVASPYPQPVVASPYPQPVVASQHPLPVVASQYPLPMVASQHPLPVVASLHPQPVVASQHFQPVVASQHLQPVVGSQNLQPVVASQHLQPVVGSQHLQPVVGSQHLQPVVASQHLQPVVASQHLQPVVASLHPQPVVEKCEEISMSESGDNPVRSRGPKEIWILRNSFLDRAKHRAEIGRLGLNLGFDPKTCTILWLDQIYTSDGMISNLKEMLLKSRAPDILLFYVGANQLATVEMVKMANALKNDMDYCAKFFPKTKVIMSILLPNTCCLGKALKAVQRKFLSDLTTQAKLSQCHLLRNETMEKLLAARYKKGDFSALTGSEVDLFVASVRDALKKIMATEFNLKAETEAVGDGGPEQKLVILAEALMRTNLLKLCSKDDPSKDAAIEPAQPSVGKAVESVGTKFKVIWIVGGGFMDSARYRAESSSLGLNLGFEKHICAIMWKKADYTWINLYPYLKAMSQNERKPDVLLLHCGDSDLGQGTENSLNLNVQCCLNRASLLYPPTEFVLSQLVPNPEKWTPNLEPCRKELNYHFTQIAQRPHFHLLRHYDLEKTLTERFSKGCISEPTDAEIDLFLSDIRSYLQETIFQDYKPSDNGTLPSGDKQSQGTAIVPDGPSAGLSITRRKEIWIFGCSFMMAANHRAETGPLGFNLGFDTQTCMINWWRLDDSPHSKFLSNYSKRADIVLIYMGNLDLEKQELNTTKKKCEEIFDNIEKFYPNAEFIISTLLPKSILWPEANYERRRKGLNSFLTGYVEKPRFHLLRLDEIEESLFNRHATGSDCCLNAAETDMFIVRIRDALLKAMNKDHKPSIENCETLPSGDAPSEKPKLQGSVTEQPSSAMEVDAAVKVSENVAHVPPMKREERLEASTASPGRKEIWIIGDNTLRTALVEGKGYIGENLGFDERHWVVRWIDNMNSRVVLLSEMCKMSKKLGMPNIVYIHVGGYDLEVVTYQGLIEDFKRDFRQFALLFPKTQFILSTILPKAQWLHSPMEESCKRFNAGIHKVADGILVHDNEELEEKLLSRFRNGSVFDLLNHHEIKTFLTSIKLIVERAMLKLSNAVITSQEPHKQVLSTGGTPIVVPETQCPALVTEKTPCGSEVPPPSVSGTQCPAPMTEKTPLESEVPPPSTSGAKQIWIVGNSFISRAAAQAKSRSYGSNFGFEKEKWVILWMGHVGMRWEALVPELTTALFMLGPPSIAFIHLGDNDLGNKPHHALMKAMKDDLTQISKEFPNTEFVFSTILPRAEWLTNRVEEQRQEINGALMEYAADVGFHVAVHEDIEETAIPRFKSGGSGTISGSEFDLFLKGIKDAMEVMIQKVESPQTDEFVS